MKIFQITQYIFLTAIVLFFGYFLWSITYPFKVSEIKTPAIMERKEYKVGDELVFTVEYCKYMAIPGVVYPELVDTVIYNLRAITSNSNIGCGKKVMSVGKTPDVSSGTYHIHMKAIYKINEFRKVEVSYETNEFKIVGDGEK